MVAARPSFLARPRSIFWPRKVRVEVPVPRSTSSRTNTGHAEAWTSSPSHDPAMDWPYAGTLAAIVERRRRAERITTFRDDDRFDQNSIYTP
jgi:hypothetical protein